jgi:four helix bundle protein
MTTTPSTLATGAPAHTHAPRGQGEGSGHGEGQAWLDAERLEVYAVAVEFNVLATTFAARADSVVRDQLRRASLSCVLNIAEGSGQRSVAVKRNLYGTARGSAMECAAIVDVLRRRDIVSAAEATAGRALLVRQVQMLTRLDQSLQRRHER